MKTKFLIIFTLALFQPIAAFSASPSVSNGLPCEKSGAVTSVKGEKYICGKNSFLKSSKNIWIWDGCISVTKSYNEKVAEVNKLRLKTINKKQSNLVNAESALVYLRSVAIESCKKGI